jgi:tRNA A37 N6-isopentenylltransferase MiaA
MCARTRLLRRETSARKARISADLAPCFSAFLLPLGAPRFRRATELFELFGKKISASTARSPHAAMELFELFGKKFSAEPKRSRIRARAWARGAQAAAQ